MTLKFQSSIGSKLFQKVENWWYLFLKFWFFWENDSGRGSCPSSFPSGNQVDGSPLAAIRLRGPASWMSKKCWPIYNFGCFLFKLMNSFIMRCCHWYFSRKVQRKRKLGSYSAIHLLDESEMSRPWEILVNLVIFKIFKIFWEFSFFFFQNSILIFTWKLGGKVGSTSPPGGNKVDGLPPASSTKTV